MVNSIKSNLFWDFIETLYRWRRLVLALIISITILSAIIAFIIPKEYKATTKVVPALKNDMFGLFGGSNLGSLAKDFAPLVGAKNVMSGGYNYLSILDSRRSLNRIIDEFNLINVYKITDSSRENALKELRENLDYTLDEYGAIEISVYDRDRFRAANMVDRLVGIVNEILTELNTQDARNNRIFLENRIELTKKSLKQAEDSLQIVQERSGMIITPDQTASISSIAELYVTKSKKEIEIAIVEKSVTGSNPVLQQLKIELEEIEKKLVNVPRLGIESFRLYRNVMIHQKILEYLVPMYEQAKMQEAKDTPSILVLDKSIPPEKKARPLRSVIILSGFFIGLMMAISLVLLFENGDKLIAEPGTVRYRYRQISLLFKNKMKVGERK